MPLDRVHELRAEPRVGEQHLGHDHAAEERLDRDREHLHARRERVPERVAADDPPLREAVQPRRLHVLRAERLDHARPHEPRRPRDRRREQRQHRQHEQLRVVDRRRPRWDERDRLQPAEHREEEQHEQRPGRRTPAARSSRAGRSRSCGRSARPARSAANVPKNSASGTSRSAEISASVSVFSSRSWISGQIGAFTPALAVPTAEAPRSPLHGAGEPVPVAHRQRVVVAELLVERPRLLRRRELPERVRGGAPRQQVGGREDQHRGHEQRQRADREALQEEAQERRRCRWATVRLRASANTAASPSEGLRKYLGAAPPQPR